MQDIKMDLQEKPKNAAAAHQIRLCSRSNHAGVKGKLALPLHQIMRARHQHPDEPNADNIPEERQRNRDRRKINRVIYAEILRIEFYTELIICRSGRKLFTLSTISNGMQNGNLSAIARLRNPSISSLKSDGLSKKFLSRPIIVPIKPETPEPVSVPVPSPGFVSVPVSASSNV